MSEETARVRCPCGFEAVGSPEGARLSFGDHACQHHPLPLLEDSGLHPVAQTVLVLGFFGTALGMIALCGWGAYLVLGG